MKVTIKSIDQNSNPQKVCEMLNKEIETMREIEVHRQELKLIKF